MILLKIRQLQGIGLARCGDMKIKGVDVSKLTKRQQDAMKKHSKHHTKKHMQYMYNSMVRGNSFSKAHVNAQKKVGR